MALHIKDGVIRTEEEQEEHDDIGLGFVFFIIGAGLAGWIAYGSTETSELSKAI
jgi:hypothetical protein